MSDSLDLFTPRPQRRPSIEERFRAWIAEHPEVVDLMRKLAIEAVGRGRTRIGIAALWERARWEMDLAAPEGGVKLNNSLRSRMARHLAETTPALRDAFELRELRSA